jgi:hypothetical protein
MEEIAIQLRQNANDIFIGSLEYLRKKDFHRHYRTMAVARELYHFFEEVEMINLCNRYFQLGIDKDFIPFEEIKMYEEMGKHKGEFLIGLVLGWKEFLKEQIDRQQHL